VKETLMPTETPSGAPGPGRPAAAAPELPREGWLTTQLEHYTNWGRKNSLWPMPFGTACCAIEFMSVVSSHYDLSRFGAEVVRFSPRQSDLMIVAGTVVDKMGPILKQVYEQMPDPKWVIAMGVCASSGGFYRAYHVMQGIDEIVPVDIYVPGCPPTPEGLMHGIIKLQEMIARGETRSQLAMKGRSAEEQALAEGAARRAVAALEEGKARAMADAARGRTP
jgi:NADH-quinone oxidoreductase subunit B